MALHKGLHGHCWRRFLNELARHHPDYHEFSGLTLYLGFWCSVEGDAIEFRVRTSHSKNKPLHGHVHISLSLSLSLSLYIYI